MNPHPWTAVRSRPSSVGRAAAFLVLGGTVLAAVAAPVLAPHGAGDSFPALLNAPPTRVHLRDDQGAWHAPYVHPWRRISQLEQTYEEDRSVQVPLRWLSGGRVVSSSDPSRAPLLLLGADSLGRDVFGRTLFGARTSLGLAAVAALGALLIGVLAGSVAGYAGGFLDDAVMRATDLILVLPTIYVVMTLRSMLPLVLSPAVTFALLGALFAIVGAPIVARGVRGVVRTEQALEYAVAARSLGAGPARVLVRHLLPAAAGVVAVEIMTLIPGFIIAEATLSYVGFGFPDVVPSWGTMLHEATNVRALADFPWLLAPAVAMFVVVLCLNTSVQQKNRR
jgi:peptide/nickel transport system permease protein